METATPQICTHTHSLSLSLSLRTHQWEREKERERKRESERENIYGVFEESQLLKKKKFLKNDSSFEEFRQLRVECDAQKCSQGIFRPV